MKKRIINSLGFILIFVIQTSCKAHEQSSLVYIPTPVWSTFPEIANRTETIYFSFTTLPEADCHAGIGYYGYDGKWTTTDLPTIESDKSGNCTWTWEVPENAKDGIGEFRGYIQFKDQSINIYPATFCIEKCS
ncbi:MAG: hypothetical protein U0Z26_05010 [Anaerolineales bacterium]